MTALLEETALRTMPLARFAEALAATTPTPGGGCAAAVPGALAAGLVAMVARLSAQSDPFSDLSFDLEDVADEADRLRAELLDLVDENAGVFERVIEARRMSNETAVQSAYRAVVELSLGVCSRSARVLELAEEVAERGNPNAAADAGVATVLAAAALEAAALTAELELGPVDDEEFRDACIHDVRAARSHVASVRESVMHPDDHRIELIDRSGV